PCGRPNSWRWGGPNAWRYRPLAANLPETPSGRTPTNRTLGTWSLRGSPSSSPVSYTPDTRKTGRRKEVYLDYSQCLLLPYERAPVHSTDPHPPAGQPGRAEQARGNTQVCHQGACA